MNPNAAFSKNIKCLNTRYPNQCFFFADYFAIDVGILEITPMSAFLLFTLLHSELGHATDFFYNHSHLLNTAKYN